MLVKLFTLDPLQPEIDKMAAMGITIRRPIGPENYAVIEWIKKYFPNSLWAAEAENAFFNNPKTIYIALREGENGSEMLGFACWDATVNNFFGPTGVKECERGKGIGRAMMHGAILRCKEMGIEKCCVNSFGWRKNFYNAAGFITEDSTGFWYKILK